MEISLNSFWSSLYLIHELDDNTLKWDKRFLELAQYIATWSKDPSTKVGAVLTDGRNRIYSVGYNGFARRIPDRADDYNNRELKYERIIHAETNAIFNAHCRGYNTCYTFPLPPCLSCTSQLIQNDIRSIVAPSKWPLRWDENIQKAFELGRDAGLEYRIYDVY